MSQWLSAGSPQSLLSWAGSGMVFLTDLMARVALSTSGGLWHPHRGWILHFMALPAAECPPWPR